MLEGFGFAGRGAALLEGDEAAGGDTDITGSGVEAIGDGATEGTTSDVDDAAGGAAGAGTLRSRVARNTTPEASATPITASGHRGRAVVVDSWAVAASVGSALTIAIG